MSKLIVDAEKGIETIIEFSAQEKEDFAKSETETAQIVKNIQTAYNAEQASKDAARQAVLDKLGLTADEIAALLA